jgi:hypothetical protein
MPIGVLFLMSSSCHTRLDFNALSSSVTSLYGLAGLLETFLGVKFSFKAQFRATGVALTRVIFIGDVLAAGVVLFGEVIFGVCVVFLVRVIVGVTV